MGSIPGDEAFECREVELPPHPADVVVAGSRDDHELLRVGREPLVKRDSLLERHDLVALAVDVEDGQTDRGETHGVCFDQYCDLGVRLVDPRALPNPVRLGALLSMMSPARRWCTVAASSAAGRPPRLRPITKRLLEKPSSSSSA